MYNKDFLINDYRSNIAFNIKSIGDMQNIIDVLYPVNNDKLFEHLIEMEELINYLTKRNIELSARIEELLSK